MKAYFAGRGVTGIEVARTLDGHPILPRIGEKVSLGRELYYVDDIYHNYERMEIRVYLVTWTG